MPLAVRTTGIDHIVLRVRDPVKSVTWYGNTLGLQPVRLAEFQAGKVPFPSVRVTPAFLIDFFKEKEEGDTPSGDAATTTTHLPSPGSDARRNTGFDHFCLTVDSNDIGAVRKELEAAGAVAEQQFDGVVVQRFGAQGTASSIYIRDPDGYVVELRTYGGGGNQATTPAGAGAQAEAPATDTAATDPDKPLNESKCAEGSGI